MAKKLAAAGPVEGPWLLPEGWRWEALGSLGAWCGGGTPSKARPDFWMDGTIPWVSPKDMKRPLIDSSEDSITASAVTGSSAKMVSAGSVLCVMRSGILRHTFPVAVNTVDVTLNQDMRALTPRSDVEPRYLAYYLQFTGQTVLHTASKAGTTVNSIEAGRLDRHPVPLISIDQQQAIVDRIDELFAEIDDGEAALARTHDDLATWRKALLKAAVTGELTADWRDANLVQETGVDLLKRILVEQSAAPKKGARSGELLSTERSAGHLLPKGWARCLPNQIVKWSSGKFMPDRLMKGGEIPVYGGNGIAGFHDEALVSEPTLVIGRVGHYCGNAYSTEGAAWISDNAIYASKIAAGVAVQYLRLVFEQVNLRRMAQGGAQPFVSQALLNSISIPLPGPLEQIVIVQAVERGLTEAKELELFIEEGSPVSATLRQSVLAAAFRGELA